MEQASDVEAQYYIETTEAPSNERTLVLKQDDSFLVTDESGDIDSDGRADAGLFHEGTRFLSSMKLSLANGRPLLLNSAVRSDNVLMTVDLTNPDMHSGESGKLPRGTLCINRSKFLWNGTCYETVRIHNFGMAKCTINWSLRFAADYADIFEVRGQKRERRVNIWQRRCRMMAFSLATSDWTINSALRTLRVRPARTKFPNWDLISPSNWRRKAMPRSRSLWRAS